RLSTAVQPNRVHHILYGPTLDKYVCGELIGKTLVEKTATPVRVIITDRQAALDLRSKVDVPVIWIATGDSASDGAMVRPGAEGRGPVYCHPRYAQDAAAVRPLLENLNEALDLAEPFGRIREAIAEARKMGVTAKAT